MRMYDRTNFTRILVFFFMVSFVMVGCRKESVNLREMTPEQQFEYAKRLFDKKDYYKARMQLTIIVLNNPGHQIIENAQYYLAESHYFQKEYLLAVEEYEKLIRSLPRSEFIDDSRFRVAMCYFKLSPKYSLDQEYTLKAISFFQQFLEDYPDSEFRAEADIHHKECVLKLAKKEYKSGELYRKMGALRAAVISFDAVLEKHHDTEFADDALYWKGECHRKMREWDEAKAAFKDLVQRFVQSPYVGKAEGRLKMVERDEKKFSEEVVEGEEKLE